MSVPDSPETHADSAAELPSPQDVVDFWFGAPGSPHYLQSRPEWFRKDPAFDALIESRFGELLQRALHGRIEEGPEAQEPLTRLARIIVCDQFPRNVWRDRPSSFALDPIALATANTLIGTDDEHAMPAVQRIFVYMPLMHSEVHADQVRSVQLFEALTGEAAEARSSLDFAYKHELIIRRFGRFPHRNEALGRHSTDEESAFLKEPGSGF